MAVATVPGSDGKRSSSARGSRREKKDGRQGGGRDKGNAKLYGGKCRGSSGTDRVRGSPKPGAVRKKPKS